MATRSRAGRGLPAFLFVITLLAGGDWLCRPAGAAAQDTQESDSAAVLGRLLARETKHPIGGAVVQIVGTHTIATTDSAGGFELLGLAPGVLVLEIRAPGYTPGTWRITLAAKQVVMHEFQLDLLAYELPGVVVEGKRGQIRFADFERRRQSRMGYFLTQEQIERLNPPTLIDVLVTVRGVEQVCISNTCVAKMVRAAPGCYPQYFIDGQASTPFFARNTPPQDIHGIEIDPGASETPAEFLGSNSACGVIAIWTKSTP